MKLKNYDGSNVFNNNLNFQKADYKEEDDDHEDNQVVTEKDLEIFEDKDNHIEEIDIQEENKEEN